MPTTDIEILLARIDERAAQLTKDIDSIKRQIETIRETIAERGKILDAKLAELHEDAAVAKVKAGLWGALSGAIVSLVGVVGLWLLKRTS